MRLFGPLFRKAMPNGHIWRGKQRLFRPIKFTDIGKLEVQFEVEERNMFLLRHSYLTPEQSCGHAQALGKNEANYNNLLGKKKNYKRDDVTIESQLAHLRFREPWD